MIIHVEASQPGRTIIVLFCDVDGLLVRARVDYRYPDVHIYPYRSIYPNLSQPNNSDKMPLFLL